MSCSPQAILTQASVSCWWVSFNVSSSIVNWRKGRFCILSEAGYWKGNNWFCYVSFSFNFSWTFLCACGLELAWRARLLSGALNSCQGSLPHRGAPTGCGGTCSGACSAAPCSLTYLCACRAVSRTFLLAPHCPDPFCSFLQCVFTEVPPACLTGSTGLRRGSVRSRREQARGSPDLSSQRLPLWTTNTLCGNRGFINWYQTDLEQQHFSSWENCCSFQGTSRQGTKEKGDEGGCARSRLPP